MAGTHPDAGSGPAEAASSAPPAGTGPIGPGSRAGLDPVSDLTSDTGAGPAAERSERTWTVLIAALGGEGGGVLSSWLVDAAATEGRRVQATSVPGVAQRTGATTYYLEIGPSGSGDGGDHGRGPNGGGNGGERGPNGGGNGGEREPDGGGSGDERGPDGGGGGDERGSDRGGGGNERGSDRVGPSKSSGGDADGAPGTRIHPAGDGSPRGVDLDSASAGSAMALLPTPGNVDLLVASELLETGRAARNGMITPDRTTVIASTHRTFAIAEKSAMGDGRFDDARIRRAVRELSRRHVLTDLGKVAERAGTVLSSVLLGAVAASGTLPITRERLRASIERSGIAVEANLRGFEAGCRLFDGTDADVVEPGSARTAPDGQPVAVGAPSGAEKGPAPTPVPGSLAARVAALPESVREIARLGVERTVEYQDERYGVLYLDRIGRMLERPGAAAATSGEAHAVAREVARQLALWMCFEDIVRVADLKTRRSRIERVRSEVRAQPGQPVVITEFLKPGVDEWCSILPAWLARPILRAADRGGWRRRMNVGLHVRTSTVTGFLLLWTLARLRPLRRGMHRFREEQARIEAWLGWVGEAHATSTALAVEAAKCANLVKGYGETHERGVRNFERTMAALGRCARTPDPAGNLRVLREAALADPEGGGLDAALAALQADAPVVG